MAAIHGVWWRPAWDRTAYIPRRVRMRSGASRSLWYLGRCLQQYAPLAAEHAMWAARPANQDMETDVGAIEPWNAMYRQPDNEGTNPHLHSSKFTGYGITLRAAVDTPDEVSLHLSRSIKGRTIGGGCRVRADAVCCITLPSAKRGA